MNKPILDFKFLRLPIKARLLFSSLTNMNREVR